MNAIRERARVQVGRANGDLPQRSSVRADSLNASSRCGCVPAVGSSSQEISVSAVQVSDMYMATELSRSLAYWAAWCVDTDDPQAPNAAAAAKGFAAEAAVEACERAIQVHGGIGFTWEHVLHRYYRRAQWLNAFEGGAAFRRKEIAESLLS